MLNIPGDCSFIRVVGTKVSGWGLPFRDVFFYSCGWTLVERVIGKTQYHMAALDISP